MERVNKPRRKARKYPGIKEAELERTKKHYVEEDPDFIGGAPNYDKFKNWTPEQVMSWLNVD